MEPHGYRSSAKKLGVSTIFSFLLLIVLLAASAVLQLAAAAEPTMMSTNTNMTASSLRIAEMNPEELEFLADSEISRRLLLGNYGNLHPTGTREGACRKDPQTGRYIGCTTPPGPSPQDQCAQYKRDNPCK